MSYEIYGRVRGEFKRVQGGSRDKKQNENGLESSEKDCAQKSVKGKAVLSQMSKTG